MDDNRKNETAEAVELEESALDQASGGRVNKPVISPTPKKGGDPEDGGE